MPKAEPRSFNLEPIPSPTRPMRASRPGKWRGVALAASFVMHGLAIAALQFWPGGIPQFGDRAHSEALTVAFQTRANLPQSASEPEPEPEPAPAPKPEPTRRVDESQPPEPEAPELPVILVVMNAPPMPQLRFQPAVELAEPSVDFPKPKPKPKPKAKAKESQPEAKPAQPASSQRSKALARTIAARPTRTPSPAYPSSAVARKLEGTAIFALTIDASGKVTGVDLVRSSGHPALDQAGMHGVRRWRFSPAMMDGVAVASKLRAPVAFRLN